jgi:hypothetical protein
MSLAALCVLAIAMSGPSGCASTDDADEPAVKHTPKPPVSPATDGCDAIDLAPPKTGEGTQVSIDLPLAAGEERQVCKLVLLDQKVNLNWSEGVYTKGSHHGLTARSMYRDALPTENIRGETVEDASQVATCEAIGSDWDVLSVIAGGHSVGESPKTSLHSKGTLPDDVALEIDAGEVLILNLHMINLTDHAVHACYKQNLNSIPDAQVKQEAGTMFYYNSFVTVPARQRAAATMACPVQHDVTLGDQVSHMHRRGVGYKAKLLDGDPLAGGKEIATLYEGAAWDEPLVNIDAPARKLSVGQWIQWSCEYENTEDRAVAQGQQTTDEMCMFLGTYWPRSDAMDFCMPAGAQDWYSSSRLLSNGTMNGMQFLDCWSSSPQVIGGGGPESSADRYASQRCFTESCANVSGRIGDFSAGTVDPTTVNCD